MRVYVLNNNFLIYIKKIKLKKKIKLIKNNEKIKMILYLKNVSWNLSVIR